MIAEVICCHVIAKSVIISPMNFILEAPIQIVHIIPYSRVDVNKYI